MSFWKLVLRSLFHYWAINLMVLLGVALTSAIISGALVVGDSVRESLRRNAEARLSGVGTVLVGGERFFSDELASRVSDYDAPVLQVEGTVGTRGRGKRANKVQILGVDHRFWTLSRSGKTPEKLTGEDWFAVNDILADRIEKKEGATLICKVEIPGELSKDAPLSGESEQTQPFTGEISAILGADDMGRYSLRAEQVPRPTVFMPLKRLQSILEKPGKSNLILSPTTDGESFKTDVSRHWNLTDAALQIKEASGNILSLSSSRIFIDPSTNDLAAKTAETSDVVLTYLANKIRFGDKITPYSMVTGTSANLPSPVSGDLGDNEIILCQWAADDLGVKVGDTVTLDFYVFEAGRKLVEKSADFTVHSIGKIGEQNWDQSWTPEFPGIFQVDDLDEWEPGIPIDRSLIRDKDEDFWDTHRATPKAFVTLEAARNLFANRFGDATSVRFQTNSEEDYRESLKDKLSLGDIGLTVRNVSEEAARAVKQSFDFGTLFASMSFFLIVAALVLAALVFVFGVESRKSQIGLLLATGFTSKKARQLFLAEAALLSIDGALLGLLGGWLYTNLALKGMSGAWRDAATGIDFVYHVKPITLIIAFLITVALALVAVWIASRSISKIHPGQLISGSSDDGHSRNKNRFKKICFGGMILFLVGALGCLLAPKAEGTMIEKGLFFGAGFCLTLAGICLCGLWLGRLENRTGKIESLSALGRQNTVRRRGRSLSVIGLMAAGVFMVTAINSFRLQGEQGAMRRDSGTGGFTHVGESTLPVYEDLNSKEGREKYGLEEFDSVDFRIIPFRVSNGDDASCLNLNRAQRPRLMGVDEKMLTGENSPFTFTKNTGPEEFHNWKTLSRPAGNPGGIPAIVDMNTATYALHAKTGDLITYQNTANESFDVEIAAFLETSILQGNLIISEKHFTEQFPNSGGYRYFLLDCSDREKAGEIAAHLTRIFEGRGLEMRPASDRLNEFNAVQNTYLSIFSTLGGLGVLLGTIGLAIVVGRNVMERRGQLGLMQAIGFNRESLSKLILSEHWFLHLSGVLIGVAAALVAVLPKIINRGSDLPWLLLIGIKAAILIGGLIFCWLAAKLALRGKLIDSLRSE